MIVYVPEISSLEAAYSLLPVFWDIMRHHEGKKDIFFPAIKQSVFRHKQKGYGGDF